MIYSVIFLLSMMKFVDGQGFGESAAGMRFVYGTLAARGSDVVDFGDKAPAPVGVPPVGVIL